jgi:phage N-6-adenine-methyltransferase
MINRAKQHANNRDDWETPDDVFDIVNNSFDKRIILDVAADESNTKCEKFYSQSQNGLLQSWECNGLWWCNPPYSLKEEFLVKAWSEYNCGHPGIILLPSSQETLWFRQYITAHKLRRVVWPGRIQFLINGKRMTRIDKDGNSVVSGNTGGSVLVAFIDGRLPQILHEPWVK